MRFLLIAPRQGNPKVPLLNHNASNSAIAISKSKSVYPIRSCSVVRGLNQRPYPSTTKFFFDTGFRKYEALGNVEVSMKFKAKNAYNLELKFIATCTFQPQNPNGEILIKERTS